MPDPPPQPLVASSSQPVDNRNIRFSLERGELDLEQLLLLLNRNAFWAQNRRRDEMERAIAHSHPVVSAWDGDRLIGFGRATSDGVYRAVLWDIVVDSDYRRQGIGRKLVETLISHPHLQSVERIYVFTTPSARLLRADWFCGKPQHHFGSLWAIAGVFNPAAKQEQV
jgi:ribosomal protein S18 acetylase RimI-like enzyme